MAAAKGNTTEKAPARQLGPRPCFILFEYDEEGAIKLDAQGKPVVGSVPEGFDMTGKGVDVKAGDPAVTRKADAALAIADMNPNLRFVRVMVK